jgi:hypothetical protein
MKNLPYIFIVLLIVSCANPNSKQEVSIDDKQLCVVDSIKLIDYREIDFFDDFKSKIYLKKYLFLTADTTYYYEGYSDATYYYESHAEGKYDSFIVRENLKPYKIDIIIKLSGENNLRTTSFTKRTFVFDSKGDLNINEMDETTNYLLYFEREDLLEALYSYDPKDSLLLDATYTYGTIKYNENLVIVFFPKPDEWLDFDPPRNEDGSYEYTPIVFYIETNDWKLSKLTYNPTLKKNKSNYNYKSDATFKYGQYLMSSIILDIEKLEFSTLNKSLIDLIEAANNN